VQKHDSSRRAVETIEAELRDRAAVLESLI
jgi:hypothetical protein